MDEDKNSGVEYLKVVSYARVTPAALDVLLTSDTIDGEFAGVITTYEPRFKVVHVLLRLSGNGKLEIDVQTVNAS